LGLLDVAASIMLSDKIGDEIESSYSPRSLDLPISDDFDGLDVELRLGVDNFSWSISSSVATFAPSPPLGSGLVELFRVSADDDSSVDGLLILSCPVVVGEVSSVGTKVLEEGVRLMVLF
jgi:hypothetical protein